MINLAKTKILITGGAGLLGRSIVEKLLQRGVPRENIFIPRSKERDLRIWENCVAVVASADVVIHLAAITGNLELHRNRPADVFYENLLMGFQLLEAARQAGVEKFVGIGTAAEYPEQLEAPFKEEAIWQGYPQRVHAPYAIAKKMLLAQGMAYHAQYGFNAIHLLLTNIYGPQERAESGYVIPQVIKKIIDAQKKKQDFIQIWGSGNSRMDFLYAEEAAEGVLLATERYDKPDPVNIGSGIDITIKDLVRKLCVAMDYHGEVRFDSTKPEGQLCRLLDTTKAEQEFGFRASTSIDFGLKKTIEWFREAYKT